MVFNREGSTCFGRGFSEAAPGGILENFLAWVVRAPAATPAVGVTGGPGWYVIDDQSALGTDPYIVISNHTAANVAANPNRSDETHKIWRIGFTTATAAFINVDAFLWWDATSQTGWGQWANQRIATLDSGTFVYDFRGGPEMLIISSRIGTDWDSVILGEWTGDANLRQGTNVVGTLQSGILTGTLKVIQLASGEAANFTDGYKYYIWDIDNNGGANHMWLNYVTANSVDTYNDRITLDEVQYDFPIGSVIAAYSHRFYQIGNVAGVGTSPSKARVPYVSMPSTNAQWDRAMNENIANRGIRFWFDAMNLTVNAMDPNDRTLYAVQRPFIVETYNGSSSSNDTEEMNEAHGPASHLYVTSSAGIAQMLDGRTINNLNFIYIATGSGFDTNTSHVMLVPDYDSIV